MERTEEQQSDQRDTAEAAPDGSDFDPRIEIAELTRVKSSDEKDSAMRHAMDALNRAKSEVWGGLVREELDRAYEALRFAIDWPRESSDPRPEQTQ